MSDSVYKLWKDGKDYLSKLFIQESHKSLTFFYISFPFIRSKSHQAHFFIVIVGELMNKLKTNEEIKWQ